MKPRVRIKDKEFELFLSWDKDVTPQIERIAEEINHDYLGKEPTLLTVMNGAMSFCDSLLYKLIIPVKLDAIRLRSYDGTKSTGTVTVEAPPKNSLKGQDVIIVEDIVDTGFTIDYAKKYVKKLGAASVRVATLISKEEAREVSDLKLDYVGLVIPDRFIVGHCFDYDEDGRNLYDIYALAEGSR